MATPIETTFGAVTGDIACMVTDPNGIVPKNIIRLADIWQVNLKWNLNGPVVNMLSGTWNVLIYMESVGPQPELVIKNDLVPFSNGITADPNKLEYDVTYTFPPYPLNNDVQAGVYKLVAVLTCTTPNNTPGPFAGFDQAPLLQFYAAP